MVSATQSIGSQGELIALQFARSIGYKLYRQNVRIARDEIDLIMYDPHERMIVFIEVKSRTRSILDFGPEANLTKKKRSKLFRSARAWTIQHEYEGPFRIDVIYVVNGLVTDHLIEISE